MNYGKWIVPDERSGKCDLCERELAAGVPYFEEAQEGIVACHVCKAEFDAGVPPHETTAVNQRIPFMGYSDEEVQGIVGDYSNCDCDSCRAVSVILHDLNVDMHDAMDRLGAFPGGNEDVMRVLIEMSYVVQTMNRRTSYDLQICSSSAAAIAAMIVGKLTTVSAMDAAGKVAALRAAERVENLLPGEGKMMRLDLTESPELLRALPPELRSQIEKDFKARGQELPEGLTDNEPVGKRKPSKFNVH